MQLFFCCGLDKPDAVSRQNQQKGIFNEWKFEENFNTSQRNSGEVPQVSACNESEIPDEGN